MIPQVVQSAQVWECRSCGSRDHKSCSCNSTAFMVKLLAEKHLASKEKARQRQQAKRSRDADVDNVKQFPTPQEIKRLQPTPKDMENLLLEQLEEFATVLVAYIGPRTASVIKALRHHMELCEDLIQAKD